MSENSKNVSAQSLRSQYLRLYTGSAESDMLSAMTYSNAENNFTETYAPAFSIVGETTISGIADAITPDMASDGFLSRFTTITYKGGAVPQNKTTFGIPCPDYVLDKLNELLCQERSLSGHGTAITASRFIQIRLDDSADEFNMMLENWCMEMLDQSGDREHFRQAWNRCQLKVLKLAGLCAVCQRYSDPVINIQHMAWASRIVFQDIANVYDMINNGETALTGNAENTMSTTILDYMKRFLVSSDFVLLCNATNIPAKTIQIMRRDCVVPISYLNYVLSSQKIFVRYKYGYTKGILATLEKLVLEGALEPISKAMSYSAYKTRSVCYKLLDIRGLDEVR